MIGETISHYKILEKLGEGGMGVVYKAQDTKLDRIVALKFLPPELTKDSDAKERFIHEAKAASAIEHENICNIHEIDETEDGHMFIAMARYDGESLQEKIEKGPLKIDEAIDIGTQIAEGLHEAHERGIVHRDIKPANIMITNKGDAKIMDFGLAKLHGQTKLTKEGTTLGTVAYMSPEQSRGEEVDHRTDIWSLGVVLYEMLTGQTPFRGDYEQAVVYSILNEDPEPVTGLRTGVPMKLEGMIAKALTKNPQERYQHIDELAVDLQRMKKESTVETLPSRRSRDIEPKKKHHRPFFIGGLILAIIIIAVLAYLNFNKPRVPVIPSTESTAVRKWQNSIAVLPFRDFSPEKDQEYFCDGMTDALIGKLSSLENLKVISMSSALRYKNLEKDMKTIGRELDVATILEGSIQKEDNRIRLSAQLINVADDAHLWAEAYDRELESIFAIQDEISKAIVDAMRIKLMGKAESALDKRYTENLEAYDLYMRGRFFWSKRTEEDMLKAVEYFEKALEHDPDYALAYSGLADTYCLLPNYGSLSPEQAKPKAKKAALKALELDDKLAEAHASYGFYNAIFEDNPEEAERELLRAIELNPGYATGHHWYGLILDGMNRPEDSMREIEIAFELDPINNTIQRALANSKENFWDWQGAEKIFERALEIESDNAITHANYSLFLQRMGRNDESSAEIQYAMKLDSNAVVVNEVYVEFLFYTRQYDRVIDHSRKTFELDPSSYLAHVYLGHTYLNKQMFEEALAIFENEEIFSKYSQLLMWVVESRMGQKENLRTLIEEREKQPENSYVEKFEIRIPPYSMALLYTELGDQKQVFKWLEEAYEYHDSGLKSIRVDPEFDNYRTDTRYVELLKKMGLDP